MAVKGSALTVGTSAVNLGSLVTRLSNDEKQCCQVQNSSSVTIYVGGSNVSTSVYGMALAPGDVWSADLYSDDDPYVVAATPGNVVRVLWNGVQP